jgi:multicomponent Na+:H+ antiporter subunit E
VLFWFLAWGEFSLANLVSGVAAAGALLIVFPPRRASTNGVKLNYLGAARLCAYVLGQLVPSNVLVSRLVLRADGDADSGVLPYRMRAPSDEALNLMAHVIALTPGTMTVDADRLTGTLQVHFLRLVDVDAARASLRRIDDLVTAVVGGPVPSPHDGTAPST